MSDTWNIRPSLIVLAVAVVATGCMVAYGLRYPEAVSGDTVVMETICRQLLANTTVGRQGLVSSVWWPPLPVLLRLPLVAVSMGVTHFPIASLLVAAGFGVAILFLLESIMRSWSLGWLRFPLLMALVIHPAFLRGCTDGSSGTTTAFLVLLSAYVLMQWAGLKQLRFLIYFGLGAALLLLTEAAAAPWVLLLFLLLLLEQAAARSPRARREAVLILGLLPAVYSVGLWVLMNWLIMGDGLYFLRSLWAGPALEIPAMYRPGHSARVSVLLCLGLLVLAAARRDRRGGYLAVVGTAPLALAYVLAARGISWGADVLVGMLFPLALLAAAYAIWLVSSLSARVARLGVLLPLVLSASVWLEPAAGSRGEDYAGIVAQRAKWLTRIEQRVTSRHPYGKLFVCGYEGFKLLGAGHGDVFELSLDFNFRQVKKDYYGHDLYVLINRPAGRAGTDSVHWQYKQIFDLGHRFTLYDETWGDWRLFEVIQAPRRGAP